MGSHAQGFKDNYFRLQYNSPIGQYGDFYSQGFGMEYGHTFYFDVALGDLIAPGIDVTFIEVGFNSGKEYDYKQLAAPQATNVESYDYITRDGFLMTAGPKVGLAGQMELIDGLFIGASVKYCPTLVFGSRTLGRTALHNPAESAACFAFSNRLSLSAELEYSWFSIGAEFIFGRANLDYNKDIIPYPESEPALQDKIDLGMNTFKFFVGFNF